MNHRFVSLMRGALFALLGLLSSPAQAAAPNPVWNKKLPGDVRWHELTALGTLLVGTDDAILAFDPATGDALWTHAEFKKSSPQNIAEVPGTPILIANHSEGLGGTKSNITALDYLTGKVLWTVNEPYGQYLGAIAAPAHGLVLVLLNDYDPKAGAGVYLKAFELAGGAAKWSLKVAGAGGVRLYPSDTKGGWSFIPRMDLSGYHDPVIEGDFVYLPYLGVQCVDLRDGTMKWSVEFKPGNPNLKKTYAPLRLTADTVYGAGGGSVYALDKATGAVKWKSERISEFAGLFKARDNAIVSQLEIVGDRIFARYGGNFSDGKNAALHEPLGIVVLDVAHGNAVYHFDKAKEGITNLLYLPEINTMLFADAANIYGLDVSSSQPAEAFKVPIEFKRKMGGGDIAKIGLGLTGGLMGLAKAAASTSKARLDVPVACIRQNGYIVVQGKQHLLGFDPATKAEKWSLYYAAPSDALANIAMFAVTAAASLAGNAQVAANGGVLNAGGSEGVNTIQSALDRYNAYTEKRAKESGGSKSSESFSYILTKLEKSKEIGLYGVNLATGATDRELAVGEKDPDYQVDEATSRIFFFKGKDSLVCYQFQ